MRDIVGSVAPGRAGDKIVVERRMLTSWERVATGRLRRSGKFRVALDEKGFYRVIAGGDAGPTVRVR